MATAQILKAAVVAVDAATNPLDKLFAMRNAVAAAQAKATETQKAIDQLTKRLPGEQAQVELFQAELEKLEAELRERLSA